MRITSLELSGFKRMQLNQVETFTIVPTEPIQLILGTNGSGKSSLINELTPLPPNPADYFKHGSKTIRITHQGRSYVLKTVFEGEHKHSFLENDVELNVGGKVNVQRELVRQNFCITPEIHELLTGQERFSGMLPTRRREWFTQLCDTNYDYAIAVFKKLQTKKRDIEGALKLAKKRLVTEQAKVISAAEEEKLQREVLEISRELEALQSERAPVAKPSAQYEQEIAGGLRELEAMSMRLLRMRFVPPVLQREVQFTETGAYLVDVQRNPSSLEDLAVLIDSYRSEVAVCEELLSKAVLDHERVEETVRLLKRTGAEGVQELTERAARLQTQLDAEKAVRRLGVGSLNPQMALQALESVQEALQNVFMELPENSDKRYSQSRLQELSAQLLAKRDERARKANEIAYLQSQKSQLEAHKDHNELQCPSCHHRWFHGYSESAFQKLVSLIAEQEEKLAKMDREIPELEADAQTVREYGELYRSYVRTTQAFPILEPLWSHVQEQGYVARSPQMVLSAVEQYRHDLQDDLKAEQTYQQVREVQALILDAAAVGDASLAEQQLRLEEVNLHIEQLTGRLTRAQQALSDHVYYRKQILDAQQLAQSIHTLQLHLGEATRERVEMLRREMIHGCIRQLQHQLVRKEEVLSAVVLQKGIIKDLELNIIELTVQEQAAELLVKTLSPTDGLIAEGLLGFIRLFVGQINSVIRKIWAYPLLLKDCGVVDDGATELDYKFPLMVRAKDNVVPDVKQGSTGMREIVDLAFKVTAMQHLGLAESPLYLDEFAASFDVAHRSTAMTAVKALMDQKPFTQLFMVSHYESSYGSLTQAQICVLCPANITVPVNTVYNQHVNMT